MTDYPVPEKRETTEWRFDDGGLLAGPYSYNELQEYVELGYIQPETEVIHEDGRKFQAFEIGLFPGFVPEKPDPVEEERNTVIPLPGWNALAGIVTLTLLAIKSALKNPENYWLLSVLPFTLTLGGFAMVLLGCYTGLTGVAHDYRGIPQSRPVFYRIGAVIVIYLGILSMIAGAKDLF
ncbi:hypothetical protein [Gimesia sp.]|uniref:hypothetical protein n=1 Tax=Gimesia sp. TaxID=2024833 RepID=UPI003A8DB06D